MNVDGTFRPVVVVPVPMAPMVRQGSDGHYERRVWEARIWRDPFGTGSPAAGGLGESAFGEGYWARFFLEWVNSPGERLFMPDEHELAPSEELWCRVHLSGADQDPWTAPASRYLVYKWYFVVPPSPGQVPRLYFTRWRDNFRAESIPIRLRGSQVLVIRRVTVITTWIREEWDYRDRTPVGMAPAPLQMEEDTVVTGPGQAPDADYVESYHLRSLV